ncbi:MAG: hypothetical protein JJ911_16885 [Rhizobiaceae bacterium]|nr:hypothetical protein [Rhizobiaceae bacterium]
MRQNILAVNGYILLLIGLAQVALGLLAYFSGAGPLQKLFEYMPMAILPFTEAFALAALFGIIFIRESKKFGYSTFWNKLACTIHLILGSCNLMFWPFFTSAQNLTIPGIAATVLHFSLVIAELYAVHLYASETNKDAS